MLELLLLALRLTEMPNAMLPAVLDLGLRAGLTVVLVIAVFGKLRGRAAFTGFAATLVPLVGGRPASTVSAVGVVVAELLAAATLVAVPLAGYAIAAVTFAVLAIGVGTALRRGLRVSCACFGGGDTVLTAGHAVRNLVLTGGALTGLAVHQMGLGAVSSGVLAAALVGGGVAGWCVTRWDDIAALFG